MRVAVVSDDKELLSFVGARKDMACVAANPATGIPESDLFIWDCLHGFNPSGYLKSCSGAQHLVLTDPKYVGTLAEVQEIACILLKPVNAFTLRAFLDLSLKTWQTHGRAKEADALRGDRDALLQYVLEVNLKLQVYDQERSNFLARALHDLRTPLTALQGYCGLLAEGHLGAVTSTQQELLNRMSHSTKRLSRLASGTLELLLHGRLERTARFREECIQECLERAIHDVNPLLADKTLRLEVNLEPAAGSLSFEAEQIQQVFVNLLENSCKFTPRGGNIQVRGRNIVRGAEVAHSYQVEIIDSGPGIAAERAEWIFEEYATYAGADDRSAGGLGLAICRRIINAHGGAIWATPDALGGAFSIVLPQRVKEVEESPFPPEITEWECAHQI